MGNSSTSSKLNFMIDRPLTTCQHFPEILRMQARATYRHKSWEKGTQYPDVFLSCLVFHAQDVPRHAYQNMSETYDTRACTDPDHILGTPANWHQRECR